MDDRYYLTEPPGIPDNAEALQRDEDAARELDLEEKALQRHIQEYNNG